MDPITLSLAIAAVIFAATGPILAPLWQRLKAWYGRVCSSSSYLRTLDRGRLTTDIQHMLTNDANLRAAAGQYYLTNGGAGGVRSVQAASAPAREKSGGFMSDFSDSDDGFD